MWRGILLVLLGVLLVTMTGCASDRRPLEGYRERVEVIPLSKRQLISYATTVSSSPGMSPGLSADLEVVKKFRQRLGTIRPDWASDLGTDREVFGLGAGAVVGYVADIALKQMGVLLRKQAERYQASYGAQTDLESAWADGGDGGLVPAFDGIEIRRELVALSSQGGPNKIIMQAVFVCEPMKADAALIRLVPMYIVDRAPRALHYGAITLAIQVTGIAVWVESPVPVLPVEWLGHGATEGREAFDYKFVVPKYTIGEELVTQATLGSTSKWFAVYQPPKVPWSPSPVHRVPIRFTGSVTEADTSKAARIWRGLADLLDRNRSSIVEVISSEIVP